MRFRPEDGYSKPICGDRHNTTGFLLRVRVKKNRVTQANMTKATKCTDTTSLEATASCNSKENKTSHLLDEQINSVSNIAIREDGCKDNVSGDAAVEDTVEKNCTADNIKNVDAHEDKSSPKRKKNLSLSFDNDRYENLSQETDYELPRLKILGRTETEFKFTSML